MVNEVFSEREEYNQEEYCETQAMNVENQREQERTKEKFKLRRA